MTTIVGIDLGTTNSEVAVYADGKISIITDDDNGIVPSVVGLDENGAVIVGRQAMNQAVVAPERTVLSIKRRMGSDAVIELGENRFSPQEISAFILKALKQRAEKHLGRPVTQAVITVPAYFTDVQRQATREAGQIAGLEVVRIINEPTAAALTYERDNTQTRRLLVYDLGGGTFDVSIVTIENGVVEVLASTGDNKLGGDDFDKKIVAELVTHLKNKYGMDVSGDRFVMARLLRAAETAKCALSTEPYTRIEEDHLTSKDGQVIHLSMELNRDHFETLIEADLSRTMQAVTRALKDADMLPGAIDQIILVGGSTRIPRITQLLEEKFGIPPHGEIDPDLCVAMGAGIQSARETGQDHASVLVDITPYTFGTSAVGEVNGEPSMSQFVPLIRRNTKLPASRSEVFYTMYDNQEAVDVTVYQGEEPDATENVLLGNYLFNLTKAPAGSQIALYFDLNLNGILKLKALEKHTGKYIDAVIENALPRLDEEDLDQTRQRIDALWPQAPGSDTQPETDTLPPEYTDLVRRAQGHLSGTIEEEDREEIVNLIEDIRDALKAGDSDRARQYRDTLDDLLFYIED
ncbi:chaperone protein DnaK [Desulfosarcina ovata subsp. sediminis]|uniref:Chaperone protein DnaK n=1 Tax=Desulfosarcina ovata subsp. sediminis TaxID=885957 RepID=A0A5K7ZQW6_9BACT|nr:Hsp70 family protein [Desulfosarcina ovata]BBO82410.1 chaperone protein DnaK [Desulfosarcina ovata subsp. sediminis]